MAQKRTRSKSFFMRERPKGRFGKTQWLHLALAVLVLAANLLLFSSGKLEKFEYLFYDEFLKWKPRGQVSSEIVLIPIDDESIEAIGTMPWPEHYYAEMVRVLSSWGARAVILDVFLEDAPSYEEELRLESAITDQTPVYFPVRLKSKEEKKIWVNSLPVVLELEGEGLLWEYSIARDSDSTLNFGHVNEQMDEDGTLRRVPAFLATEGKVFAHLALRVAHELETGEELSPYSHSLPLDGNQNILIPWVRNGNELFPSYSYSTVIRSEQAMEKREDGLLKPEDIEGKICLIAPSYEQKFNRVSPTNAEDTLLNAHGVLLNGALTDSWITPYSKTLGLVILCGIGIVVMVCFLFVQSLSLFTVAAGLAVSWLIATFSIFTALNVWLPVYHPLILILSLFVFSLVYHQIVATTEQTRLFDLATRDGLTGLYVIRHFREILNRVVGEATATGERLSLILLDIDNFKPINDNFGHPAGDEILRGTAKTIFSCLRSKRKIDEHDYVGRYGGEEFIVLLRHVGMENAASTVAERIRFSIEKKRFEWEGQMIPVTVSLGVAELHPGEKTPDAMVHRADQALYVAKRSGKNRVCTENSKTT